MFITGGRGLLGRHLQRSEAVDRWELVAPGSRALDIRRRERVLDEISGWKPACVVHLAYRNDDRRTIVDGSRNVAEAAAACGARLIHLSTDVVFAGRAAPYSESDPPFAITDYGMWKAEAERAVTDACPTAVLVRTSLMYATDSLAPMQLDVQRALTGQSSMAFFTDEFRCPAHAADVAAACGTLATMPDVTGPLHVAGPQVLSRIEIATTIARWLGLDPGRLRSASLTDSGLVRPSRIALDVTKAASLGIHCRPMSAALH